MQWGREKVKKEVGERDLNVHQGYDEVSKEGNIYKSQKP